MDSIGYITSRFRPCSDHMWMALVGVGASGGCGWQWWVWVGVGASGGCGWVPAVGVGGQVWAGLVLC